MYEQLERSERGHEVTNFAPGTLVLLKAPTEILTAPLHTGMIGEVKDSSKFNAEIPVGEVAVEFPNTLSNSYTGLWKIHTDYLVPLGDSGILSEEDAEDNPYKVRVPSEVAV